MFLQILCPECKKPSHGEYPCGTEIIYELTVSGSPPTFIDKLNQSIFDYENGNFDEFKDGNAFYYALKSRCKI